MQKKKTGKYVISLVEEKVTNRNWICQWKVKKMNELMEGATFGLQPSFLVHSLIFNSK